MTIGEQIADELYGLHCDIGRLERENAKLRELVLDMWCDSVTRMSFADRHAFIDKFIDRTRKLGIEVN